ncbi:MAG: glycosyltransferase family 4 protein [Verrucomicrobiia bacterium]|jgi:glycosyltransferase involved in cell wall biosynthesis
MKVAILSHYATWTLEGRAGYRPDPQRHPAPWVASLAQALAQQGAEVHVVTQTDEVERDMEAEAGGVRLHFVRCPRRLRAATLFMFDCRRLHRALRRIRPDIVHSHGTEDAYTLAAGTSGYPFVMTMQGLMFRISEKVPRPVLSRTWVIEKLERWSLRRAPHIIAKSEHVVEAVGPLALRATFHRIPNPMNPVFLRAAGEPEGDRLLFAGVIAPVKGMEHLVAALPRIRERRPGARLGIIGVPGRGSENYFAAVQAQVRQLGLEASVEYLGFKRPEELAREMARASVVVVPSLEEMFCNVAAEAMAVGRPVVASRVGSLPQLIADGRTGLLVPAAEPVALAEAVVRLLDDEALRARLGASAREWARQWEPRGVARQTLAVYETVLRKQGSRSETR